MQLRDYQEKAIASLRNAFREKHQRVLLVAPTGAGKTVMFSYLTKQLTERGNRVLLLAHRDFLLEQISETLSRFSIPHGFIAARRKLQLCHLAQVAGVHTIKSRVERIGWQPDWIICDEAHHATAGSWNLILQAYPSAKVIGVTATPERLDGTGLGEVFDSMVMGPQVKELMDAGFLSRVKYIAPQLIDLEGVRTKMGEYVTSDIEKAVNRKGITGHVVEWYSKICGSAPAIAFCASIAHSETVAEGFREAGFRWQALHSKASYADNQAAIAKLASGELHGISSCDIVSEGFDVPIVTAAILLRPTKSLGLHLQQIGRVLRPAPNKECAIVIDHVGNVARCKAGDWEVEHGKAEDAREWSLDGKTKSDKGTPLKRCKSCLAIVPASASVCPECGAEFEGKPRAALEEHDGTLVEIPAWVTPDCKGHKQKIMQTIEGDTEKCAFKMAWELIPKIPDNVYSKTKAQTLFEEAVKSLESYILALRNNKNQERQWILFDAAYAAYLKVITGALCATARTMEEFEEIAKLNGYKKGWAYHRYMTRSYARG